MNGFIQYISEMETTIPFQPFAMAQEMVGDLDVATTTVRPAGSATLRLYDIFIPLLGVFIILLNLLVVISSGLILKKGKSCHVAKLDKKEREKHISKLIWVNWKPITFGQGLALSIQFFINCSRRNH